MSGIALFLLVLANEVLRKDLFKFPFKAKFYDPKIDAGEQLFEIYYPVLEKVKKEPK